MNSDDEIKISEDKTIRKFIEALELYPFTTHIEHEVAIGSGRADIRLPDYDVVIEAKGHGGDIKRAIGQAIWYSRQLGDEPYLLVPPTELSDELIRVCKDKCIGLLTLSKMNVQIVNDIGGLEAFQLYEFDGPETVKGECIGKPHKKEVVGGKNQ